MNAERNNQIDVRRVGGDRNAFSGKKKPVPTIGHFRRGVDSNNLDLHKILKS